jgi:hypothetical protein
MTLAARASEVGELGRTIRAGAAAQLDGAREDLGVLRDRVARDAGHQAALAAASLHHQAEAVRGGTALALRAARAAIEAQAAQVLGLGPEATLAAGIRAGARHRGETGHEPRRGGRAPHAPGSIP